MNICEYLDEYGDQSFDERPFNEVDSLIFAELSYLNFENFIGWTAPKKTLIDFSVLKKGLVEHTFFPKSNNQLLKNAATCTRFQKVKAGWFESCYDEARCVQFAAITFKLEDGTAVITFRGTDVSVTGWKEDFNMAFLSRIPAQGLAVEYLKKVAAREPGNIIVCGHSKGGNLAVYSSVFGEEETRRRIKAIYNHDGPGFNENIFTKREYIDLYDRIFKIVPHDSLVGVLLEHTTDFKVVPCKSVGAGQHNPFTWKVADDTKFKEKRQTTIGSKLVDKTMYDFVNGMNEEERQSFVNGLFAVIEGSGAEYLYELKKRPMRRLKGMVKAYLGLTGEEKKLMTKGGMKFAKIWLKSVVSTRDEE